MTRSLGILTILLVVASSDLLGGSPADRVDFVHDVQPILRRHCDRCHGNRNQEGGLRLNDRDAALGSADSDLPIIVPHDADESLLIMRISGDEEGDQMPIDSQPMSAREIKTLRGWIEQGAIWPDTHDQSESHHSSKHWAYQPIIRPLVPAEADNHEIDFFVQRQQTARKLKSNQRADRYRLIRRVSLALVGLPPTPAEAEEFVNDRRSDAYERLVDRLLASPRFGGRWAVPWLDLARYADSNGFQADQLRDNWAYRDWVIRALNQDMPFDQFVIDQLAGDLHDEPTEDQRIASGFHRMTTCNVEAGVHPEANRVNQVVDRVNTTATVFLGTTLECAQCHDHKYDPFTQADYYRLFAYFNNTPLEVKNTSGVTWDFYGPSYELSTSQRRKRRFSEAQEQLDRLTAVRRCLVDEAAEPMRKWIAARSKQKPNKKNQQQLRQEFLKQHPPLKQIDQQIAAERQEIERTRPPSTLVMVEQPKPRETFVMIRGDYENRGASVRPGTPVALTPPDASGQHLGETSAPANRMDLARWLTAPRNPLLARVTVNRWWGQLFGHGIVGTPEDFGSQGDPPTHPQLLDWLAAELIQNGWSRKAILKAIVMSDAFCQSSDADSDGLVSDPENRWLTRGPRFRMSAEMIRDNGLAISGILDETMYGRPVMPYQPSGIWRSVGRNQPKWQTATDQNRFRRGVYVIWKRAAPYPSFVSFDAPNRSSCTVRRSRSNTPLQALTLLNDPAYVEMAIAFAERIVDESPEDSDRARLDYALRCAVSRPASDTEQHLLIGLLNQQRHSIKQDPGRIGKLLGKETTDQRDCQIAAWFAVASTLLNLDEVICR